MTAPALLAQHEALTPGGYTFSADYQITGSATPELFAGVTTVHDGQTGDDLRDTLKVMFAASMGLDPDAVTPLTLNLQRLGADQ